MAGRRTSSWQGVENAGNIVAQGIQDDTQRRMDFEQKVNAALMNRAISYGKFDQQMGIQSPENMSGSVQNGQPGQGRYVKQYPGYSYQKPDQTPQEKAQSAITVDDAKKQLKDKQIRESWNQNLGVINQTLGQVPPSSDVPLAASASSHLRGLGASTGADPRFRDAQAAIKSSLTKFLITAEGISPGRINKMEIDKLTSMIGDLPYLTESDRQKRLQLIDQMVPGAAQSVDQATQPGGSGTDDFIRQMEAKGYKYRGAR